jgi:hypothetical protein
MDMSVSEFPMGRRTSRSYEVNLRSRELAMRFYRPVRAASVEGLTPDDLASNATLGRARRWSDQGEGEDATQFFGISCFDSYPQALANARAADVPRHLGLAPRWRGIAEFTIDPSAGHTYANTFESGHWTAWGEATVLLGRVREVHEVPMPMPSEDPDVEAPVPVAFKVVDGDSGNTVAYMEDRLEANACLRRMVFERPDDLEVLVSIGLGKGGLPCRAWLRDSLDEQGVG